MLLAAVWAADPASFDPVPITAYLLLFLSICTAVGLFYKYVFLPQLRVEIRAALDEREIKHAVEHGKLELRFEDVDEQIDETNTRISKVDQARVAGDRRIHARVDKLVFGPPRTTT